MLDSEELLKDSKEWLKNSHQQSPPALYEMCNADDNCRDLLRTATLVRFCVQRDVAVKTQHKKMFLGTYSLTEWEEKFISDTIPEVSLKTAKLMSNRLSIAE